MGASRSNDREKQLNRVAIKLTDRARRSSPAVRERAILDTFY